MRLDADAAERLFETAFAGAPTGMALVGLDGSWLRVNDALCRMMGLSEAEMLRRTFQDLTHPADLGADLEHVDELLAGRSDSYTMEKRYVAAGGRVVPALLSVSLVRDHAGRPLHFVKHVVDITERKRMEEQLRLLATHDELTGIWNRRRFEEELARQLARSLRHGESATLLTIELDGLRAITHQLGSVAGDQVLSAVARVLARRLRGTDSVARLGPTTFAVLLCNTDGVHGRAVADELAALIAVTPLAAAGHQVSVHATVGLAVVDRGCTSVTDILEDARRSMEEPRAGRLTRVEPAAMPHLPR